MGYVSHYDLNYFITNYKVKNFIETGTLHGEGVEWARRFSFDKIISIEIEEDLAQNCRDKFSSDNRVHIITGDSSEKIQEAVDMLDGPCIYWLDAHFPGGDRHDSKRKAYMSTELIEQRVPLMREIEIISASKYFEESVLLIDDARLFEKDNPDLDEHLQRIDQGDVTRDILCPYTTDDIFSSVESTHNIIRIDSPGGGNFVVVPITE